ncbi:MAG: flippase-like domain-containing protein [Anaerolineae bacterium]|nr:flippase-like domain-containing protein [Anaerolineae bacterium]
MEKLKNSKLLAVIKWVWMALVLAAVVWYVSRNYGEVKDYFRQVHWLRFPLSMLLMVLAKAILAQVSRISVAYEGWQPGYWKMFSFYSLTQLGKYLPGGVWHFVGRFGAYKAENFDTKKSLKAIIAENVWLISSALVVGMCFLLVFNAEGLGGYGIHLPGHSRWAALAGIAAAWLAGMLLFQHFFVSAGLKPLRQWLGLIGLLLLAWLLIGLSYACVFPEINARVAGLAIGGFSLSWSIGYLTIFAPGGIGVRELAITLLFSTTPYAGLSPILATVHRLVWVLTEVLLGVVCVSVDAILKKKEP